MRHHRMFSALLVSLSLTAACSGGGAQHLRVRHMVSHPAGNGGRVVATNGGQWLNGAPVHSRMVVGSDGNTYLGLWVDTPAAEVARQRAPLDVALVVDTSGSMSGAKIANARMAAASFIESLAEGDIVSLYSFSDSVRPLVTPVMVDHNSRVLLMQRIQGLYASGGTNLYAGLQAGASALSNAPESHPVRRVVLISDGRATVGQTSAGELGDLAARTTENGTQITAIGVGLDYDESTLGAVAVRSAGRLYHLEQPEQMAAILHGELELLGQTVASNAWLEFEPSDDVVVEGTDNLRVDRQGTRIRVPLGSLYGGQHREVLLRARIATTANGPRTLGTARLQYRSPGASAPRSEELSLRYDTTTEATAQSASTNERVLGMVSRYEAAQSQLRAVQMLNQGQAQQAEAELQRAEDRLRQTAQQHQFSDQLVQGALLRQAEGVSRGRAAARRAASAPSPASSRGAALMNNADAMHSMGY